MNIANFQKSLQLAIDNSTTTIEYLFLSRALVSLNMGQIRRVSTYANLPSAASNEGLLVFVAADERLYWSTGTAWYNLIDENKGLPLTWGTNGYGRLGDNTTINRSSPVSVVGGLTDFSSISAGGYHTLGLRSNGTVWSWGNNSAGRLGDGTTIARSSPVSVVGGYTDWCQVSAGGFHSLGVRSNGTAWAWGEAAFGKLGDNNDFFDRSSPSSIAGGFTDWCQLSAGTYHSAGVRTNGTIWTWGFNGNAQLGNGTTSSTNSPVSILGGCTDWCQVSAGNAHTLGVRTNGTAWGWGCNGYGRLGDGTTTQRNSPVSVAGGFSDWCQMSAGRNHSLGLRSNGTAWAWGYGYGGKLGDGTTIARSSPVSIIGGYTDWCQVSAGYLSAGIRTNGTAWTWGLNNSGQLGDGTTIARSSPVSVIGGYTDWCHISAGTFHTAALRGTNFC